MKLKCDTFIFLCAVAVSGSGVQSSYPSFTTSDCQKLGTYVSANSCGSAPTTGLSAFTCSTAPRLVTIAGITYSEIQVRTLEAMA